MSSSKMVGEMISQASHFSVHSVPTCARGASLFLLDGLRCLGQPLDLEPLRRLEEGGQLVLGHVHLAGIHELEDRGEMLEGNVFEDDDGVLGGVLLQEGLEVGRAGGEDHLVGLAGLSVAGEGDVGEGLLVPQVLEARHHVGLEVVPAEAELLLVALGHGGAVRWLVVGVEKGRYKS